MEDGCKEPDTKVALGVLGPDSLINQLEPESGQKIRRTRALKRGFSSYL